MNIEKFRDVIAYRAYIEEISQGEWADGIEECHKKEVEILTEDISTAVEFLKNECTADEYVWISEILDDIVETIPSEEFVQCYKELAEKFPKEYSEYNIAYSIECAEDILQWEDLNGEKA